MVIYIPVTTLEFYEHICSFPERFENRNLESYLSALFLLVQETEDAALNVDKLLHLLETAFTSEAIAFDNKWLLIRSAPDENVMSRKFTNPEIQPPSDKSTESEYKGKEFTLAVLRFQIAELHRMRDMPHVNKSEYLGLASETGNYWYNFDPFTNLECGARCLIDSGGDGTSHELICNWETLGELLEMGRVYE